MKARIFKPSRHTMQVGCTKTRDWVLEYEPTPSRFIDPLMSWTGSTRTQTQVRLKFKTKEAALVYAHEHDICVTILPEQLLKQTPKAYADNFACDRLR